VDIYKGLLNNQKSYEKSLDDLQLICNEYMDNLVNYEKQQPIGEIIELIDNRNSDKRILKVLGINVRKMFMPSRANVSKTDLSKYKVIKKDEFVYSAMQVGRDETVRVALYSDTEPAIVSPAYFVFTVKAKKNIIPEFLMLWFFRPEFNRYGWFLSDSSVRSSLDWERFCQIKIPVPDIEVQKAIVTIYHTLQTRKRINDQLKDMIKPLCPVLMKGVMDEITEQEREEAMV
jgi:type I restriction enzyme S subunit